MDNCGTIGTTIHIDNQIKYLRQCHQVSAKRAKRPKISVSMTSHARLRSEKSGKNVFIGTVALSLALLWHCALFSSAISATSSIIRRVS